MTSEGKIRVAICDDHGLFRHGVSEMLSLTEDLEVLGEGEAEMLGGSLRVDSEPGAGTRVELRVPLNGRNP